MEFDIKTSSSQKYIGQNIKRYRKAAKLTQKELSQKLGVAEVTIRQWESWNRVPPLEKLFCIAEFLNVDIRRLIFDESAPPEIFLSDKSEIVEMLRTDIDFLGTPNSQQIFVAQVLFTSEEAIVELEERKYNSAFDEAVDSWCNLLDRFPTDKSVLDDVKQIEPLVIAYLALNKSGKNEAVKRVVELTEIARYTQKECD